MICQMFSPLSDVVVMLASRMYSFLENAGRVGVPVRLSNDIAQPLQVNTGGKVCIFKNYYRIFDKNNNDPISSIDSINQTVTFGPSQTTATVSFDIVDDSVALELPQLTTLRFTSHNYIVDRSKVILGPDSTITVVDDDGKYF